MLTEHIWICNVHGANADDSNFLRLVPRRFTETRDSTVPLPTSLPTDSPMKTDPYRYAPFCFSCPSYYIVTLLTFPLTYSLDLSKNATPSPKSLSFTETTFKDPSKDMSRNQFRTPTQEIFLDIDGDISLNT